LPAAPKTCSCLAERAPNGFSAVTCALRPHWQVSDPAGGHQAVLPIPQGHP